MEMAPESPAKLDRNVGIVENPPMLSAFRRLKAAESQLKYSLATAAVLGTMVALASATLNQFGARYTDEDQTMFWVAAKEIWHGHFREPCFYGQAYNTLWEAVLAAVPIGLGANPAWVVPIVALSAGLAPYVLLGAIASRRSRWWGLVVMAVPLLLPAHFWLLNCLASYNGGVLCAAVALFVLDTLETPLGRCTGFGLLALALWVNPNSLILVLPAAAIAVRRAGRGSLWGLPGVGVAIGIVLASRAFYSSHPAYRLHVTGQDGGSFSLLADGLQHLDQFWSPNAPESPFGALGPFLVVAIAAAAIWKRSRLDAMALASGVLVAVLALGAEKTHNGIDGVFFDKARMFLAVPALAAFSVAWGARSGVCGDPKAFGSLSLAAIATLIKLAALPAEIDRLALRSDPVSPMRVTELIDRCEEIARLAQGTHAHSVLFESNGQRTLNYGCGAYLDGRLTTIHPPYERRTWLFLDKVHSPTGRVLVLGVEGSFCHKVEGLCAMCGALANPRAPVPADAHGAMVADCGETPLLDVLRRGDVGVRPF